MSQRGTMLCLGLVVTTESPTTCLPVFDIKNPGWVSRQATNIPDAKTEDECKATCVAAPACVSYQIELKPGGWSFLCYLQYIEQNLNKDQLSRNDAITEYVLVRRCETTTENPEKGFKNIYFAFFHSVFRYWECIMLYEICTFAAGLS